MYTLFWLVSFSLFSCHPGSCASIEICKVIKGFYFYGDLLEQHENVSNKTCLDYCTKTKSCLSVNYIPNEKRCELMTDLPISHTESDQLSKNENCTVILKKCSKDRAKRQVVRITKKVVCGKSKTRPRESSTRIVGGFQATPNSFPWTVSIQQDGNHRCGGTLIPTDNPDQSQFVLCAAHCFFGLNNEGLTVKLSAHDLYNENEKAVVKAVKEVVVHPDYDEEKVINDISLIQLAEPVKFSDKIQPICLPKVNEVFKPETKCIAAGWGSESEGGSSKGKLMQVQLSIIDLKVCNKLEVYSGILKDKEMICAGFLNGGKDACQGDSGGPLITKQNDVYVLPGVVSFGEGCARKNAPGIYAKVSNYIPWINKNIQRLSGANLLPPTTTTTTPKPTTTTTRPKPTTKRRLPWRPKPWPFWHKPWGWNNNFYG